MQTTYKSYVVSFVSYSSAVGAGFYGNEEAHKGLQHFIEAASDVQETINRTESQVKCLTHSNTVFNGKRTRDAYVSFPIALAYIRNVSHCTVTPLLIILM